MYILIGVLILLLLALLEIGQWTKMISKEVYSTDVMIMLDVSKSMEVVDKGMQQPRLQQTKEYIESLIFQFPHNRYGLWIFAGESVWIIPLTNDLDLVSTMLWWVDRKNIVAQGSNIPEAIEFALNRFWIGEDKIEKEKIWWVLMILSDGWEDEILLSDEVIASLKKEKVQLILIGVWDPQWWPVPNGVSPFWAIERKTYNGEIVISKPKRDWLKELAESTWWLFFEAWSEEVITSFQWLKNSPIQKKLPSDSPSYAGFFWAALLLFMLYLLSWLAQTWLRNSD